MLSANNSISRKGFTLLEILISVTLVAVVAAVVYSAFNVVTVAWNKMNVLADDTHHGDYAMDQVFMGLRSLYHPERKNIPEYAFMVEDSGDESDKVSWVKLGAALVGKDCPFQGTPHRVDLWMDENERGDKALVMRAWRIQGQPEDFDPENIPPIIISDKVVGFNVRMMGQKESVTLEWIEEWEDTNRVPLAVEITLNLLPLEKGGEPVEFKRVCSIPCAPLSW